MHAACCSEPHGGPDRPVALARRRGQALRIVTDPRRQASQRVQLTFPEHLIKEPLTGRLVREFDVLPNIRRASIEDSVGWMVLELVGKAAEVERALVWLTEAGVQVDRLGDVVES